MSTIPFTMNITAKRSLLISLLCLSILAPVVHIVEHTVSPHRNETTCLYCVTIHAIADSGLTGACIAFILSASYLSFTKTLVHIPDTTYTANPNRAPPR